MHVGKRVRSTAVALPSSGDETRVVRGGLAGTNIPKRRERREEEEVQEEDDDDDDDDVISTMRFVHELRNV